MTHIVTEPIHDPPRRRGIRLTDLIVIQVILAVVGFLVLTSLADSRKEANNAKCKSNLKHLAIAAVGLYVNNHGALPTPAGNQWFAVIYDSNTLRDPQIYLCPSDGTGDNVEVAGVGNFTPNNTSYWGRRIPYSNRGQSQTPMAADESVDFHGDNINAVYMDGHVELVPLINGRIDPLTRPPFRGTLGDR